MTFLFVAGTPRDGGILRESPFDNNQSKVISSFFDA
jgi:hypothetical protein